MNAKLRFTLEQVADAREQRDALARSILAAADTTAWYRGMARDVLRRLRFALRAMLPLKGTAREIEAGLREAIHGELQRFAERGRPG